MMVMPACARDDAKKRKAVTQWRDGLFEGPMFVTGRSLWCCVVQLLDNYMRQCCKREAGKQKHNHAERCIWIFDRHTCFIGCFVLRCGPKRYLTPQLLHFSFVLDGIVHLPVPSESLTRRGKKFRNRCRGEGFMGTVGVARDAKSRASALPQIGQVEVS